MKSATAILSIGLFAAACGNAHAEANKISLGINSHDGWGVAAYDISKAEQRFILLSSRNITSYRIDVDPNQRGIDVISKLLPLAKKYNIQLRPMLNVNSSDVNAYYNIALKFASDIQIWELGNELNLQGAPNFYANVKQMLIARQGVEMASAASGRKLETTLNIGAALYGVGLNNAKDSYPFIDTAIQMGLKFDYISFHYYPSKIDRTSGWYKIYLNPLRKYRKPVLFNETHCSNIYRGDDGNSEDCAFIVQDMINEINTNYSDLIYEVNLYELVDNPAAAAGPEQHFGLLYDLSTPKRPFIVVANGASVARKAEKSYVRWANNRQARTDGDFVRGLYAIVLGRTNIDSAVVDGHVSNISLGQETRRSILLELLKSDQTLGRMAAMDNEAYVSFLFLAVLGRQIDGGALNYYAAKLNARTTTRQQFLNSILGCPEAGTYLKG